MENDCQYRWLYRLLRDDEFPKEHGITAKLPDAQVSVHDHVSSGSICSQYISTSATWDAIMVFANKKLSYPKRIAKINVDKLKIKWNVVFIDLTEQENREDLLDDARANNFARKFEEVLIVGEIPSSCVKKIYEIEPVSEYEIEPESDTDSDSDFGYFLF